MKYKLLFLALAVPAIFGWQAPKLLAASQTTVAIMDNSFSPQSVTIPVGTTLVWTNQGAMMHTVTADNGMFDSGTINPRGSYTLTFNTPGTYRYYCRFHGAPGGVGMSGIVVVSSGSSGSGSPVYNSPPMMNHYQYNNPYSVKPYIKMRHRSYKRLYYYYYAPQAGYPGYSQNYYPTYSNAPNYNYNSMPYYNNSMPYYNFTGP